MASKMSRTTPTKGIVGGGGGRAEGFEDYLDALLADLQNTVPGHNQQQHGGGGASSVPGYGSLNGVRNKQQTSPVPQTYQNTTAKTVTESRATNGYNGSLPRSTTPHNSLPRSSTPQKLQTSASGNLSELDSLLQDLSSARYGNVAEKQPSNAIVTSPSPYAINDSIKRPSVDSLLEELSNAHSNPIYAVPHGNQNANQPGRQVTITVRETTTEKLTGTPSAQYQNQLYQQQLAQNESHTSSATKELDDLMASLSDFKISAGTSHQHQSVTDYAKPNQGTSHYQSTLTTVSTTEHLPPASSDQLDSMLGNLTADMSRQGVNTTQKGCCNACDKPIVGQVITALGKTWHPEHFTCNHCNQELGTRNFFERDGNPYCEPDYHNLFSPRCAYCNGPILDKCVTALEKTWHTEHFFCAQCGQQFGEDGFHERDGKPYCRNDYFDMFAPKCNGCNRAIMENYISALNSQWHPDCFVCRDCREPFHGGSFFDHEGLPYCETHYHAKRGSLCAGCSKPITGRCITAMFKKFHPEHFVCAFCLKQLNKGTFKEQNDKPYCHQCFDKLFG
ncbi:leupaxin isoform X1 [Anopheles arabiensis]|uniref:LIM zinc-binding domain-containing protein n=1 Tax=Anopheles arabiensis TaxID=7173 RepID=A0A2C9GPQ2_ANOAR|nr:leupaxin isoform X1 [Anopheles arabiensis]XP_040165427.1 leupaxin isoform X1 [Anopheles arabiensis]XP_040165429.1 leupaxin isoform X1 [Anopheles arabiensis]